MSTQLDIEFLQRAARVLNMDQDAIPSNQMVTTRQAANISGISLPSIQRYAKQSLSLPRNDRRVKLRGVKFFGNVLMIPLRSLNGLERSRPGPKIVTRSSRRSTIARA